MAVKKTTGLLKTSVRLTELKEFFELQKATLEDALRILDEETIDDKFSIGCLLKDTENMLKRINADIKKKSNT